MIRRYKLIFFLFTIFSCKYEKESISNEVFPTIRFDKNKDTLAIGEEFEVKIYLSDPSYYYLSEPGFEKVRVYPVFKINNEVIEKYEGDTLTYKEIVSDSIILEELPFYRQVRVSLAFPHPESFQGEIQLNNTVTYVALPN